VPNHSERNAKTDIPSNHWFDYLWFFALPTRPCTSSWNADKSDACAKRNSPEAVNGFILKYINATKEWGLNFFRDTTVKYGMTFIFFGFCDSSHADDLESSRSTGGYFFFLRRGQGCICSKSGQTPEVALSSTEAETIWACNAATQGAFIKQFLDELKIFGETSFELMEDSQPAINAQRKNVSQSRFRPIKIKYHYIRQLISEGWCKLVKISTKAQVADMATKILPTDTVKYFSNIVLGITEDQSLYVYDTVYDIDIPFNDWGVVSAPDFTCMYA